MSTRADPFMRDAFAPYGLTPSSEVDDLRRDNAGLRRAVDQMREKIAELEARCARLARLHAKAGA